MPVTHMVPRVTSTVLRLEADHQVTKSTEDRMQDTAIPEAQQVNRLEATPVIVLAEPVVEDSSKPCHTQSKSSLLAILSTCEKGLE